MNTLEPAVLTIFGVTGDLAKRKLLPALYDLANSDFMPDNFKIIGISRKDTTVEDLIVSIRSSVEKNGDKCNSETLDKLRKSISIVTMEISEPSQYNELKNALNDLEDSLGVCMHRLYYLAIPSTLFHSVANRLGKTDLNSGCQHGSTESRLLIEKPFGYDLRSAEDLIESLKEYFPEKQIYRIDHYLAKETVQNILTFRFDNPLFSGSWNSRHISHILITAAESIGIEGRVGFYEQMGALRDLIQSHLLQILALVTMEKPKDMSSEQIHKSKELLMSQIIIPADDTIANDTVRGQYSTYKSEVGGETQTETFAAIKLKIDNDTWKDVPMFIRTGKSLAEKATEITVVFKDPQTNMTNNHLTIRIQPNEGIVLNLRIKEPGFEKGTEDVQMDFCYDEQVGENHPDAYERVLVDALRADKTLFATDNEVLSSWTIVEPILHAWQNNNQPLEIYENGTWGPESSDTLLANVPGGWLTNTSHICPVKMKSQE